MEEDRAHSDRVVPLIVGLPEETARTVVIDNGCNMRIGRRDNELFSLTMDYSPRRITVVIEHGIVREATVG